MNVDRIRARPEMNNNMFRLDRQRIWKMIQTDIRNLYLLALLLFVSLSFAKWKNQQINQFMYGCNSRV